MPKRTSIWVRAGWQAEEIPQGSDRKDANASRCTRSSGDLANGATQVLRADALKLRASQRRRPEWTSAGLGRTLDPQNGCQLRRGAPGVRQRLLLSRMRCAHSRFDLGAPRRQVGSRTSARYCPKQADAPLDFDLGAARDDDPGASDPQSDSRRGTIIMTRRRRHGGARFDLGLSSAKPKTAARRPPRRGHQRWLDFDLNLEAVATRRSEAGGAPAMDFSAISLDLGGSEPAAPSGAATRMAGGSTADLARLRRDGDRTAPASC